MNDVNSNEYQPCGKTGKQAVQVFLPAGQLQNSRSTDREFIFAH
ncbi:hypothetical protein BRYFOR_09818 [Marvinbryantia formatexigens DSM 14469]|uniref:Uncharacterized protein n=1 Tax=Marvinbryantia formatexigens DSM 14469 TaxID=478749 RepID=C6LMB8_9FIRM|nr:hypothetical protein BRYFOR_09818 [Marvinbryantia formatexigens DSM 14469]